MGDVNRAVCFWCSLRQRQEADRYVDSDEAVFESVCGHALCPSVVFHPLCLMEFRTDDVFALARRRNNAMIQRLWGDIDGEG